MVTRGDEEAGLISAALSQVLFSLFKIQNQIKMLLCISNGEMSNNF